MKPTTILPTRETAWWILARDGIIELDGTTNVGDMTGVNGEYKVVQAEGEAAFFKATDKVIAKYNPLPAVGEQVEEKRVYSHKDQFVIAKQAHARTDKEPADEPSLFATPLTAMVKP